MMVAGLTPRRPYQTTILSLLFGLVLLATCVVMPRQAAAQAANSMYLTPASATLATGTNLTLSIRINTDDPISAVETRLTYTANLELVSIDGSASAFSIDASSSGANGSVTVTRATFTPAAGDQLVGKLVFRALAAGPATVTVLDDSQAASVNTSDNVITARSGGVYTLQGGAAAASPAAPAMASGTAASSGGSSSKTAVKIPAKAAATVSASNLPQTTITAQGSSHGAPLPGDSTVELSAPASIETTPDPAKRVSKVEYLINGRVVTTDTSPPYSHSLDTTAMRNGRYTLTTKTYYADGTLDTSNASLLINNSFGLRQASLQFRHYAWLVIIAVIAIAELLYVTLFKRRKAAISSSAGFDTSGYATGQPAAAAAQVGAPAFAGYKPGASGTVIRPTAVVSSGAIDNDRPPADPSRTSSNSQQRY